MRRAESSWLHALDSEELGWAKADLEDVKFWSYVDSQATANTHSRSDCLTIDNPVFGPRVICSDWRHARGDGCVASKSDRTRCTQAPLPGIPFCHFHFGRAWVAFLAFVDADRQDSIRIRVDSEVSRALASLDLDAAMVADARTALEEHRVYFYACGEFVKIGTSRHPERRIKTLGSTLAPAGVDVRAGRLLGTIPGGREVEKALHRRFHDHRQVGEWFDLAPIAGLVDELLADKPPLADSA